MGENGGDVLEHFKYEKFFIYLPIFYYDDNAVTKAIIIENNEKTNIFSDFLVKSLNKKYDENGEFIERFKYITDSSKSVILKYYFFFKIRILEKLKDLKDLNKTDNENSLLFNFLNNNSVVIFGKYKSVYHYFNDAIDINYEDIFEKFIINFFPNIEFSIPLTKEDKEAIIYFLFSGYSIILCVNYEDVEQSNFKVVLVNIFCNIDTVIIDHSNDPYLIENIINQAIMFMDDNNKEIVLNFIRNFLRDYIIISMNNITYR